MSKSKMKNVVMTMVMIMAMSMFVFVHAISEELHKCKQYCMRKHCDKIGFFIDVVVLGPLDYMRCINDCLGDCDRKHRY
jgi:hypothetical protein